MATTAIHFGVPPTDVLIVRTSGGSLGMAVGDDLSLWFATIDDARSTLQALHSALLNEELNELNEAVAR